MGLQAMKDEFVKLENKFVKLDRKGSEIDKKDKDKDMEKIEQLEQEFQQIQQSVKIENNRDIGTIVNQVEDFIAKIRSLSDKSKENNRPIEEERALIIDAAKQSKRLSYCIINYVVSKFDQPAHILIRS